MRNSAFLFLLVFLKISQSIAAETPVSPTSGELTLEQCFQAALKQSETVGGQSELIKQAEANYSQAIGAVLPNISGSATYQWQEDTPAAVANIFPNPSKTAKLTVVQPLFQGFKEFAGLQQTKSLLRASQNDYKQAATQLYIDTAALYFGIVSQEHDIENIENELNFYDDRIKEVSRFIKIGRSQVSERLSVQSQQAALLAQLKLMKGQVRAQRAVLTFFTGLAPESKLKRPQEKELTVKPIENYLTRLEMRPDVKAETERLKAAEEGIPFARAGHFPTLSAQGDYFLQRTGSLKDVRWDALLVLSVPIFTGGIVNSQLAIAHSKRNQEELQLRRIKRLGEQQIRQLFENFQGEKEQYVALREAVDLSEKNYKEQTRQYRLGLVTNLEVLQALTNFQENKRAFDKARYSMFQSVEQLEAAASYKPEVAETH